MARIRVSPRLAGWVISRLMKLLGATWRWELEDRGGWLSRPMPGGPVLWLCWHDRILMAPLMHEKWFSRQPAAVLASLSKDGEMLVEVCRHFHLKAARGSSSRRGAAAFRECMAFLKKGIDVCITPDGPRGPRHVLQPGIIRLAQHTNVRILPLHLRPSHAWKLKTWDEFLIPWPFAKVTVVLDEAWSLPKGCGQELFEAESAKLEALLRDGTLPHKVSGSGACQTRPFSAEPH